MRQFRNARKRIPRENYARRRRRNANAPIARSATEVGSGTAAAAANELAEPIFSGAGAGLRSGVASEAIAAVRSAHSGSAVEGVASAPSNDSPSKVRRLPARCEVMETGAEITSPRVATKRRSRSRFAMTLPEAEAGGENNFPESTTAAEKADAERANNAVTMEVWRRNRRDMTRS